MKRIIKWTGIVVAVLLVVLAGVVGWVQLTWSVDHPDTPFPAITASSDPHVIAQGAYLVHAVAHCSTCHGPPEDVTARRLDVDAPLVGGFVIDTGPFGVYTAANLTPHETGIGSKSDAELARVIRHGINSEGRLSPIMRFSLGPMANEDLTAIVSWLRVQEPVPAERAGPQYGFLARALSKRFLPLMDEAPPYVPGGEISVERGRYLADGPAFCGGCHTPRDPMAGFAPMGPAYSGWAQPEPDATTPGYEIIAPNLTPDPGTGVTARWNEDQFVARLRAGRVVEGSNMPWEAIQLMTDEDLRSIYRFLRTLPPVERDVGPTWRQKGS